MLVVALEENKTCVAALGLAVLVSALAVALPASAAAATVRTVTLKSNGTVAGVGPMSTPRTYWGPKGKTLFKKFGRRHVDVDFRRRSQLCRVNWRRWGISTTLLPYGNPRRPTCSKLRTNRLILRNTARTVWAMSNGLAVGDPVARIEQMFPGSGAARRFVGDHSGDTYMYCLSQFDQLPNAENVTRLCTVEAFTRMTPTTPEVITRFEVLFPRPIR